MEAGVAGPFALPAPGTFGNYPINTLFGPRYIQQDISLMKTFAITERIGFTLRMDSTNFFNHTNLGGPNTDVNSPTAGQITGLGVRRVERDAAVAVLGNDPVLGRFR